MQDPKLVFLRKEIKYVLQEEEYRALLPDLLSHLKKDEYPRYTICNLYFDSANNDLIRNSLDKPIYKEKLRLRSYGTPAPDNTVFWEIKRKYDGIVAKRRVAMTLEEAEAYIRRGKLPAAGGQKMAEIDYLVKLYGLKPKVYLSYEREAYAGEGSLRLTFDSDIRCRTRDLSLSSGNYGDALLLPGQRIMEIKSDDAFPLWLTHLLTIRKIYPAGYSKYGEYYRESLENKIVSDKKSEKEPYPVCSAVL